MSSARVLRQGYCGALFRVVGALSVVSGFCAYSLGADELPPPPQTHIARLPYAEMSVRLVEELHPVTTRVVPLDLARSALEDFGDLE